MHTPSHRSKGSSTKRSTKGSTKKANIKKATSVTKTKRPLSSYMLWLQKEGRAAVKKMYPEATFGETGKHCGVMWRGLSPETRNKYTAAAEQLKKASQQSQKNISGGDSGDEDDDDDEYDDDDDDSDEDGHDSEE